MNSTIRSNKTETINIITEYLDISREENDEYTRFIIDMYDRKLKEFKIDLLITVGPGINDAFLKYASSTLKSLKIINVDIDIPGRATLRDLNVKDGIEILLKFRVGQTLKQAFSLFPENKHVFVISGVTKLDSFYTSQVRDVINQFQSDHDFTFTTGLTMDSTIKYVRKIPPGSIVLVPLYMQDAAHIPFSTPEALDIISRNSPAPVFLALTDAGVKTRGSIGGYLFSYTRLGEELGRISGEILFGKNMKNIKVNTDAFYVNIYDWRELKRWHLFNSTAIPANSIYYNKDNSVLDQYKWYILGAFLFMLTQLFLILYLFQLNKKQKAMSVKMEETESMHRDLIRIDRISKMSTLTASLSHELFQPLSAIRITAQAGKRFFQTGKLDPEKASQMFENILEDDLRATGIITSVKSFLKPESREMETVNLDDLIRETFEIVRSDTKKQGIRIELKLEENPVFVFGDKIQIQQVLINFIRNAAGAMEKCEPGKRNLEISITSNQEFVTISVSDSGPGIDKDIQDKLFKPFVTTRKDGFGIGLTLCRSIIERHNGKIWVDNIPEGGAKFSFTLRTVKKT